MRALTEREKRTIRFAAVAVAAYLLLFFGFRAYRDLETRRADYQQLVIEARRLKRDLLPYENRVLLAQKLKETYRMDPSKLSRSTVVADASAAIQKAAASGKIQFGPVRESPARGPSARTSARELASIQLEGSGPVPAVMAWLHNLPNLGFPIIVDSVQLTPQSKPGVVKINLTIVILDAAQWMKETNV